MSSDFERILRDAREALPLPDEESSQRARSRAVASLRPRRRRTRVLVLAGAMLVGALALGVTAGSLNAPSGTAAREPAVLGFVPEPGWFALQSPPPAIEGQQTAAVAANVPFAADDVENGLVEPSGLPYSTLLTLPADGIVLVANMTPRTIPHVAPVPTAPVYPDVELPLQLDDALQVLQGGAQVRPEQPMAQYHLRAFLRGYNVDLIVYFGTARPSTELMNAAQGQLEGFVVRSGGRDATGPSVTAAPQAPLAVIDRTYTCNTTILGGVYAIEASAHAGIRRGQTWSKLPYAGIASGGWAGLMIGYPYARDNSLVWITAGAPSKDTTANQTGANFPVFTGGTIGVNTTLCKPSRLALPLERTGLRGGSTPAGGVMFDCESPRRVLVRLRASARSTGSFSERGSMLSATNAVVQRATLVVRTPAGKLLAYAEVSDSGRSTLLTAKGCKRG